MPPIKFRITDVRPVPSVEPARVGKVDNFITWVEDDARPYGLSMPSEDYTPERALQRVKEEVSRHALIIGQTGEAG